MCLCLSSYLELALALSRLPFSVASLCVFFFYPRFRLLRSPGICRFQRTGVGRTSWGCWGVYVLKWPLGSGGQKGFSFGKQKRKRKKRKKGKRAKKKEEENKTAIYRRVRQGSGGRILPILTGSILLDEFCALFETTEIPAKTGARHNSTGRWGKGQKKRNTGQDSEPGSRVLPCSLFFHLSPLLLFRPFKIRFWKGFGTKGGPLKRDDDILKIESRYYYSPPDEYAVRKITSRNCALVSQ